MSEDKEQAPLDEFPEESSQDVCEKVRLEDHIQIVKGSKPNEVINQPNGNADKYLVVDTLTGNEIKYAVDDSSPRAKPGDVIMIMDGSKSGRVFPGEQGILGSTMAAIRPDGPNPTFLYNFLESNFDRINSATKGSAVPHTDKDLVRSLEYGITALEEQRKIGSVLYTVDQAVQKADEIIDQLERTRTGLTRSLFLNGYREYDEVVESHHRNRLPHHPASWETKPAKEIMEVTRGAHPRPKSDTSLWGGDIPMIKIGDRNRGDSRTITSTEDTVTEKGSKSSKLVDEGTLIISNAGTVGAARITGMKACIHDHWLILRKYEDKLDTRYLYHFINWNQDFLESLASGSTVLDLSTDDFRLFDITFPNIEEQQEIADALDSIHNERTKNEEYRNQLLRLKKGLMQDLLSGEIRTHDKDIEIIDEVLAHG